MDADTMAKLVFELKPYHVALAAVGAVIIAAYWLPRFLSGREPATSALLILGGAALFALVPGMPEAIDPRSSPRIWELTSELAVIVALFGTGLRIDTLPQYRRWQPTVRLLVVVMPVTIGAVALLGWAAAGMTFAGALLLGAVLAPTDPVLAGDVQVGPPTEGGEHPVRFVLTTEAGLNDGLAFPFVYLGLLVAAGHMQGPGDMVAWLLRDGVYRITVGALLGAAMGRGLGWLLFSRPRGNRLAETQSGAVAIAGVLACYGAAELIEGYGFIAVFVAGLMLRRIEAEHAFHARLHSFNEAVEHTLTALLLVFIGGAIPALWEVFDWRHAGVALAVIFIVRPVAGWVGLAGTGLAARERAVVAFYGVRGIGSIYYLGYAAGHVEFVNEGPLWATVAFTILVSALVHGLSAGVVVERVTRDDAAT